ncbi:Uncharacterised protein [Shewanella baltica]|uniref:hypothetical protein n=1 Tax=Shewanella baltica TaxID=62322 RepID=UPI000AF41DFB|nr:Uncharacterised protein [Shewanella baltica]
MSQSTHEQIVTLRDMDELYDYLGDHKREVWAQVGIGTKSCLKVNAKTVGLC